MVEAMLLAQQPDRVTLLVLQEGVPVGRGRGD